MVTKAERTSEYIIETVAPIFNKHGYAATSLSDLTKATGLTKGALYGNFKNKEELALEAFNHTVRRLMFGIKESMSKVESPLMKLYSMCDWYTDYYHFTSDVGGCPVLNLAIDSNNNDELLFNRAKEVVGKLKKSIADLVKEGIEKGEIREGVDPERVGGRIYSMIQGSIFMSGVLKDNAPVVDMMEHIRQMIKTELET
ncbi:MAG: TetR/AcrR family transcriptional regulator [Bacteroidota bacterium]